MDSIENYQALFIVDGRAFLLMGGRILMNRLLRRSFQGSDHCSAIFTQRRRGAAVTQRKDKSEFRFCVFTLNICRSIRKIVHHATTAKRLIVNSAECNPGLRNRSTTPSHRGVQFGLISMRRLIKEDAGCNTTTFSNQKSSCGIAQKRRFLRNRLVSNFNYFYKHSAPLE
jgi:hypothetical protein